jgi:hypothetical protein
MAAKRKASAIGAVDDEPVDPSDELAFYCLGGGNEVGRSCHIIQYKGKTVMVSFMCVGADRIITEADSSTPVCIPPKKDSRPFLSSTSSISARWIFF